MGVCLLEEVPEVRLHSSLGNSEHLRHFRDRADLDDGEEDAKLSGGQSKGLGNCLRRRGQIELRLPHEDCCYCGVRSTSLASRSRGKGQDVGQVTFLVERLEWHRDALLAERRVAARSRRKAVQKCLVGLLIDCTKSAAGGAQ